MNTNIRTQDPTPEEIQAATEELQKGWDKKQRLKHLTAKPTRWQLPRYSMADVFPTVEESGSGANQLKDLI